MCVPFTLSGKGAVIPYMAHLLGVVSLVMDEVGHAEFPVTEDPGNKQSWLERKREYILRLREEPADIQLLSAADKLHNARAFRRLTGDFRALSAPRYTKMLN
jgi:hypothetical protein